MVRGISPPRPRTVHREETRGQAERAKSSLRRMLLERSLMSPFKLPESLMPSSSSTNRGREPTRQYSVNTAEAERKLRAAAFASQTLDDAFARSPGN